MLEDNKRIAKNGIIYSIRQLMSIIVPLITYAYVSRVLGVERIGMVNYSQSIVNYFVILAGLGISTYAIKEGSKIRDSQNGISTFVSEIFWLNVISTVASLLLLLITILAIPKLHDYYSLLLIFSILVPFTTLGIEWIYNIFEDFTFITIRSIGFQIISLVLLFVFVKTKDDMYSYAGIIVFSNVGSNVLNFIHARKYYSLQIHSLHILRHIKPVLFLFGMTIATTIYTTMDTTMLGAIKGDYQVGLYSIAHKIPKVAILTIAVLRQVSLPTLSNKSSSDENTYLKLGNTLLSLVILLAVPISTILICYSNEVLSIFAGNEFLAASRTLQVLSFDIVLSALSGTLVYQYVLLKKGEKASFYITLIGTGTNLLLNYFLITYYSAIGAAIATCLSELVVLAFALRVAFRFINWSLIVKQWMIALSGAFTIIVVYYGYYSLFGFNSLVSIAFIMLSVLLYTIELVLLKNNPLYSVVNGYIKQ